MIDHDPGLPDERFPFPAYSNGWARVGLSEELPVGGVQAIRYFGSDLVLFRTEAGRAHVLDAYCPHLGAHMAYGGSVDRECLRCPFHHWQWDGQGRCTDVPYAKRIPPSATVRSWPTCEENGFIFIWYHGEGLPPSEAVPALPEYADPEWSGAMRLRWKIRGRGYDMGENTVDDVHFHYLHGAASLPRTKDGDLHGTRSVKSDMKMESPTGEVDATIENTSVPGMGIVHLSGICDTLIVITSAPIDGEYVDQMFSYSLRTGGDDKKERMGRAFLRDLEKQMNEDIVCFENKRYFVRPLLCDGDGAIASYRKRARSRYTGAFLEPGDGEEWDTRVPAVPRALSRPKEPGFSQREEDELASFLRSTFKARRVQPQKHSEDARIDFHLFGRGDALKHVVSFERACLEAHEVADLRAYLAKPLVKRRIAEAGTDRFLVPPIEVE